MARAIPKTAQGVGLSGRERAIVFCMYSRVGQQICQQLEKKKIEVCLVTDEAKLAAKLKEMDPDLILVEINASTAKPIYQLVGDIFVWMRNRAREINKVLNSPSKYLWERAKVVLFKSEVDITATGSLSSDMADTDDIVRECSMLGNVHYIGIYSSLSFISKLRSLLQ